MATKTAAKKKGGLTKHFAGNIVELPTQQGQFTVPTFTHQEETIETLLANVWDEGTQDQIDTLVSLTYTTGKKILTIERRPDVFIEIVGMLRSQPFDEVIEFLKNATDPDYIFWKQPALNPFEKKLQREIALHEEKEVGVKGIGRCRFCSSNELKFVIRQTRSSDEPATVFVRCVSCQKNWRE